MHLQLSSFKYESWWWVKVGAGGPRGKGCGVLYLLLAVLPGLAVVAGLELHLYATHKSGAVLSTYIYLAMRAEPCCMVEPIVGYNKVKKLSRDRTGGEKKLLMMRDPFELVASGYRYHKEGQENSKIFDKHPEFFTIGPRVGLPLPPKNGRYVDYVQNLSENQGILAYMVRTLHTDLHMLEGMAALQDQPDTLKFCMGSIKQASEGILYDHVFHFAGLSCKCSRQLMQSIAAMSASTKDGHSTKDSRNKEQVEIAKELDRTYFNGSFAALSAKVGCVGAPIPSHWYCGPENRELFQNPFLRTRTRQNMSGNFTKRSLKF